MRGLALLLTLIAFTTPAQAQKKRGGDSRPPEAGFVFPPGGKAGSTVDVHLGGFDWTPDLQFFVLDSKVSLKTAGEQGPIQVPPPPYWFGPKALINALPLPREQPARITIPAGTPAGPVRWAVANASGVGIRTGLFWVGSESETLEQAGKEPQKLPALPVTVHGRLSRVEEVDRYRFTAAKDGPITIEVFARRLGSSMNAALVVRDATGRVLADAVDTDGQDLALTFFATAGTECTLDLHDLDFRGDRSFVYRIAVTPGPRVLATLPAMGQRGKSQSVEFVGLGVATGKPQLEAVTRTVTFPTDPQQTRLAYRLETPFGPSPAFDIPLSDLPESVAKTGPEPTITLPAALTGLLDPITGKARFRCEGKKGDVWDLTAEARRFGSPLDLSLAILGIDGKELTRGDDLPGTTDTAFAFTLPADGAYTLEVADQSGQASARSAIYRISVESAKKDFALQSVARLNVPLGGSADLLVTAKRKGGHKESITFTIGGLPRGVTVPAGLVIPEGKLDLKVPITAAEDADVVAGVISITGTSGTGADEVTRTASAPVTANLASRSPEDERTPSVLLATTMRPRIKIVAVEADGGRKVHRGSTHPAEVTVERLEDFKGEVSLQMSSTQSYQRQGITGPDFLVPADADRAFYPCFMPEWLETTRTSRMELVGVVRVPDPKGTIRYLVAPLAGRITLSIEGSILKVSHAVTELKLRAGETVKVKVNVFRSAKLTEPVTLDISLPDELKGAFKADPVIVKPGEAAVDITIKCLKNPPEGTHEIAIRGTALQAGKYLVLAEAALPVESLKP